MSLTPRLQLLLGDITAMKVDAIVNSTDTTLMYGGPVHRAVHQAAGPGLAKACNFLKKCQNIEECNPGSAKLTPGYMLQAYFIIHSVAPFWLNGDERDVSLLESCYAKALELATERGLRTIAFPSIGSGIGSKIPPSIAAPIAINTILDYLEQNALPEKVTLVCHDTHTYRVYHHALQNAPHDGPLLFSLKKNFEPENQTEEIEVTDATVM